MPKTSNMPEPIDKCLWYPRSKSRPASTAGKKTRAYCKDPIQALYNVCEKVEMVYNDEGDLHVG